MLAWGINPKQVYAIVFAVLIMSFFGIMVGIVHKPSLSEEQAFMRVFGNYDHMHKTACWASIQFPDNEVITGGYWEAKKGIVSALFFQHYHEKGKQKVVLLTKTIPTDILFDCHACHPLIGATVFVRSHGHWEIEAQNQFLMFDGEYGTLPLVKLIAVGKDKMGLSLVFEHIAETDRVLNIVVPYKNSIVNAHTEIIYYENFSECEFSREIQCFASVARLTLDKSMPGNFYGLQVKRFGTVYNDRKDKTMPVVQEVTYRFLKGHYVRIAQKGISKMEWMGLH